MKFFFAGIFAYLNYLVPATRKEILEILIQGIQRMEYRGYDSAGIIQLTLLHTKNTVLRNLRPDIIQHSTSYYEGSNGLDV